MYGLQAVLSQPARSDQVHWQEQGAAESVVWGLYEAVDELVVLDGKMKQTSNAIEERSKKLQSEFKQEVKKSP